MTLRVCFRETDTKRHLAKYEMTTTKTSKREVLKKLDDPYILSMGVEAYHVEWLGNGWQA